MEALLLGIDIGTTAVKVALFDLNGRLEAVHSEGYPIHYLRPGWVEQQPEHWWQAVCTAVRQALASVPDGRDRVQGLATSSQAPTLLALDKQGQPLRPALIWMDRRAEAQAQQLSERIGAAEIFRITGNRPDAYYVASKLLWFKTHEPDLLAQARHFLQVNGYINYRLTGTFALDNAHAALLQLRDYKTGAWSAALCEACGIDPILFPPVCSGHHVQGTVTADAAEATGLKPGIPVIVGTVDAAAAALEAGVAEIGTAAEMTGTSTVLMIPNTTGITEPALIAMPHAIPSMHLLLGAMVASGASLNWYRQQFGLLEQQVSSLLNADVFDLLTQQAAQIAPGSDGVIFLPYMMGERSPLWHTNARGVFFGLSLATSRGAVIRAVMEGAAFGLLHNLDVAQQVGAQVQEIRSVGGGARSALWNQIKADISGLPVKVPFTSVGAPFGDAMLAGMGLGLHSDILETLRRVVQINKIYEPRWQNHELYQELYYLFRDLYAHLRDDFDRAAAILAKHRAG